MRRKAIGWTSGRRSIRCSPTPADRPKGHGPSSTSMVSVASMASIRSTERRRSVVAKPQPGRGPRAQGRLGRKTGASLARGVAPARAMLQLSHAASGPAVRRRTGTGAHDRLETQMERAFIRLATRPTDAMPSPTASTPKETGSGTGAGAGAGG